MQDMQREIFGPVLHIATFKASEIGCIVQDINDSGYGLTFGLHTRIDDRVEDKFHGKPHFAARHHDGVTPGHE